MILYISRDRDTYDEVDDFFSIYHERVAFSDSTEKSIRILEKESVSMVLLYVQSIKDVAILKYINENFPGIRVFITAEKTFDEAISIFNKGDYTLLREPFVGPNLQGLLRQMKNSVQ